MYWSTARRVVALKSLQWTPRKLAFALARFYTRLLDLAIPRLRRVARRNLAMALPEFTPQRHAQIVDGVFRSIARILVTFAKFPAIRRGYLGKWIRLEGGEHFDQAREAGRGVLVATAHLGNWELSAFAHALMTAPMNVVVRPLDNPLIDRPGGTPPRAHRQPAHRQEGFRARHSQGARRQSGGRHPDRSERGPGFRRLRGFLRRAGLGGHGLCQVRGAQRGGGRFPASRCGANRNSATCCAFTRPWR